jgi:hypothetical protein
MLAKSSIVKSLRQVNKADNFRGDGKQGTPAVPIKKEAEASFHHEQRVTE